MSRVLRGRGHRAIVGAALAAVIVGVMAAPSQAQTDTTEPPPTNFSMAGVEDLANLKALAIDKEVSGTFQFCNNANGLGSELYFDGGDGLGMTVRHATVSPFVVPIHVGLIKIDNPDPDNEIDEEMMTLGVVQGTSVEFGQSGEASAQYGGIYVGTKGPGVVSWSYSGDITCAQSLAMPIIGPLINGGTTTTTVPAPTTTDVPTTTDAPTTTDVPTTTDAPTTTDVPTTTVP